MRSMKVLPAILLLGTLWFSSCKPKDADIKAAIEEKLKAIPEATGATVDVKDGIATLAGDVKDDLSKDIIGGLVQEVKGVASVVNHITITPPVAVAPAPTDAPVTITADDPLTKAVTDATKDFPTVAASVKDGIVSLKGDIKKDALPKLMMALSALHPKKIDNKLTVK